MSTADNKPPLQGRNVLVTRPLEQNLILADKLRGLGAFPITLPCIEIKATDLPAELNKLSLDIQTIDIVIFISINAVRFSMLETTEFSTLLPSSVQFAAIGKGSGEPLAEAGITKVILPRRQFDSEGLLLLDEFQQVKDKKILIIKGMGGRDELYQSLSRRGAKVDHLDVYERQVPQHINQSTLEQTIHVSLFSSSESVDNILSITPESFHTALFNSQVIAGHQRIAAKVTSLGFNKLPIIADNPSDAAMLAALVHWTNTTEI